jgi:WD40 repeat protein
MVVLQPEAVLAAYRSTRVLQGAGAPVLAVSLSPAGNRLAAGLGRDSVLLFKRHRVRHDRAIHVPHRGGVHSVEFDPAGTTLATGGLQERTVVLTHLRAHAAQRLTAASHTTCLAFNSFGLLAVGTESGVELWDPSLPRLWCRLPHGAPVRALAFLPGGLSLVTGGADGLLRAWDVESGREHCRSAAYGCEVTALTVPPGGQALVCGLANGFIEGWDWPLRQRRWHTRADHRAVRVVAVDPAGALAASGGPNGAIHLWDLRTGQLLDILHGHAGPVTSLRFRPDSQALVSASTDGTIRIWSEEYLPAG